MDKIQKALSKLSAKEKQEFKNLLLQIERVNFKHLDLKKLKSRKDIFRVRKGRIRVIFYKKDDLIKVLSIERRNTQTYRKVD